MESDGVKKKKPDGVKQRKPFITVNCPACLLPFTCRKTWYRHRKEARCGVIDGRLVRV